MKQLFLLLALGSVSSSCANPNWSAEFDALGLFLDSLMLEHGVPGVGFAVFDDGGLLYEHVGGFKSQATLEPIDTRTAFEAASISKPVFAYVVFSLARDGVLELDASLQTLVPEVPELAYDPRSGTLTPRILLTHRGGLPTFGSDAVRREREVDDPRLRGILNLLNRPAGKRLWYGGATAAGCIRGVTPEQAAWKPAPKRHSSGLLHAEPMRLRHACS